MNKKKIDSIDSFKNEYWFLSNLRDIVFNKFVYNDELSNLLIDTDDAILVEGNDWGDTTWGMVNGKGKNQLGKILMELREELIKESIDVQIVHDIE